MKEELKFNADKAHAYETNARISIPTYDVLFAMIQSYFRSQLDGETQSVLVVGAGGGNEIAAWGPSNPTWTLTGVDISEEMLGMASAKIDQHGLEQRVKLILGTIDDVPQSETKFDAASCILVLHFIQDVEEKLKLLKGIKVRLKPGAPFVLVTAFGDPSDAEFPHRLDVWGSFWLDAGREKEKVEELVKKGIMAISFLSDNQIVGLLEQAGFTKITRFYTTGLFGGWMCHVE